MAEELGSTERMTRAERIRVEQFADLLEKIFVLDPAKRIAPDEALHHPFCEVDTVLLPTAAVAAAAAHAGGAVVPATPVTPATPY